MSRDYNQVQLKLKQLDEAILFHTLTPFCLQSLITIMLELKAALCFTIKQPVADFQEALSTEFKKTLMMSELKQMKFCIKNDLLDSLCEQLKRNTLPDFKRLLVDLHDFANELIEKHHQAIIDGRNQRAKELLEMRQQVVAARQLKKRQLNLALTAFFALTSLLLLFFAIPYLPAAAGLTIGLHLLISIMAGTAALLTATLAVFCYKAAAMNSSLKEVLQSAMLPLVSKYLNYPGMKTDSLTSLVRNKHRPRFPVVRPPLMLKETKQAPSSIVCKHTSQLVR